MFQFSGVENKNTVRNSLICYHVLNTKLNLNFNANILAHIKNCTYICTRISEGLVLFTSKANRPIPGWTKL